MMSKDKNDEESASGGIEVNTPAGRQAENY